MRGPSRQVYRNDTSSGAKRFAFRSRRRAVLLLLLLSASLTASRGIAAESPYLQLPFDKNVKNQLRAEVRRIVTGQVPFNPASQATLKKYIVNALGEMTRVASVGRLGDLRRKFLLDLQMIKSPAALKYVNEYTLGITSGIASKGKGGKFCHPAVRVNAVMVMSELDDQLPSGTTSKATPPVPMAEARPKLVELATDPKMPDGVKVAALIGLERHARYGISGPAQVAVANVALAVLGEKEPPGNRSPEGHAWMRRLAIGVVGTMKSLGPENKNYQALAAVLADEEAPLSVRCEAARALGQLDYAQAGQLDVVPAVNHMAALAVAVLTDQLEVARQMAEHQEQQSAVFGGRGLFEEEGLAGTGDAEDEDEPFPRREMAARVDAIRLGLRTLAARVPEDKKETAAGLVSQLDQLFGALEDRSSAADDLTRAARAARDRLAASLKKQEPTAGLEESFEEAKRPAPAADTSGSLERPARFSQSAA